MRARKILLEPRLSVQPVRVRSLLVGLQASLHPFSLHIDEQRKYLSHWHAGQMINTGTASET